MSLRFKEKGQYLRSFVSDDSLFIDIMMNVGIIFYAALETGDARLLDVAMRHTLTTRRVLVRGDGSTSHEGLFDLNTGEFLKQTTHQGYRGDSCWTRGLAWALYGFGTCYGYTRDPRFLATAEACADFYIENANPDGVAPWDFDAPADSRKLLDTSAAAIAASGLFQLADYSADRTKGRFYEQAARTILGAALHQAPGQGRSRLGRHPQGRRLPPAQGPGRERVRDVGRVLLPGGAGESAELGCAVHSVPPARLLWPRGRALPTCVTVESCSFACSPVPV